MLSILSMLIVILFFAGGIALIVWYLKSFYAARADRAQKAEEHRNRHGGESVLEWNGDFANGAPDAEFGRLVVEVPKKHGDGAARFYEKGLVLDKKRLPYSEIKDVLLAAATSDEAYTLKQTARDMGVLWIYPRKGATIGLREMSYQFDNEIMEKIKRGLGF